MLCALSPAGLAAFQHWELLGIGCAGMLAGRALRSVSHLREHPSDLILLPLVIAVVVLIALPIKAWAALTMNTHGWLTRSADRVAGEAQSEASLRRDARSLAISPGAANAVRRVAEPAAPE